MLLTYKNSVMMSKYGIEGPHCKRTEVFSIDVVRPKKTKVLFKKRNSKETEQPLIGEG